MLMSHTSLALATEKISVGNSLYKKLEILADVEGLSKLIRRIASEIRFLEKGVHRNSLKVEHVICSNINHLSSIVETATTAPKVTALLKSFNTSTGGRITVDVIGDDGLKWYKVIMRDPKALHFLYSVGGRKGARSMKDVGQEYIDTAKLHPQLFVTPKVCFIFVQGVSLPLATSLKNGGIEVQGHIIDPQELNVPNYLADSSSDEENDFRDSIGKQNVAENPPISASASSTMYQKVNLDVTCLIAYVSATSNGGCNFIFEDKFLTEQAAAERSEPVKVVLDSYFTGRELIVCKEAADHFQSILDTIGGSLESERGRNLLGRCSVVACQDVLQDYLTLGGRIKPLSRLIFSTGIFNQAPTITSNRGFVRAAQNQGLNVPVLLHEPRALTERKEVSAKKFHLLDQAI